MIDAASALEASNGRDPRHGCRLKADIKGLQTLGRTNSMLHEPPRLARLPEFNNPVPKLFASPAGLKLFSCSNRIMIKPGHDWQCLQ